MSPARTVPEPLGADVLLRGRYRIERFLEAKHEANLYRALDTLTDLFVIVKERGETTPGPIPEALADSEWAADAAGHPFQDEFLILRSVRSSAVVKALDIFRDGERAYLVLEQLEGRDLAYFLTGGEDIPVQQTLDWVAQICDALGQLHAAGILHLDLQPRYLVVSPDRGQLRLTGFHRATMAPVQRVVEATPGYSPPEQFGFLEGRVSERSDLFSLGAIWHQLLTTVSPEAVWEQEEDRFVFADVSHYLPSVHPHLERLVRKLVAIDPLDRFSSCADLRHEIQELLQNPIRRVGMCSDVGMLRTGNEDALGVFELTFTAQGQRSGLGLYICADGMGGVNAGEIASAITVDEVTSYVQNALTALGDDDDPSAQIKAHLQQAVKQANARVHDTGRGNSSMQGMGTTVTTALVFGHTVYVAHVGDSCCYLINRQGIEKVSRDHSLVGRLVELGQITPEEALVHPQRNLIYRSLGTYPNVEVDLYQRPLRTGDWLLLCSDGLTGHVSDPELQQIVTDAVDPTAAAQRLVNLANQRGGEDNITVVLVQMAEYR
ncbi:MAG: Stp1/IreP family PP2C-type Ser/Thr phosphatase [Candidatus Sericytochromatia bacterium]|nr:Stp1/IreP family PP2C-type Ser/Thr phosphatase [Candidatus Sericytochromatia bacterium]